MGGAFPGAHSFDSAFWAGSVAEPISQSSSSRSCPFTTVEGGVGEPSVSRTVSFSTEVHGDRATLVSRRFLRHPPMVAWRAVCSNLYQDQVHSPHLKGVISERVTSRTSEFILNN
jgi:hypothetical protein